MGKAARRKADKPPKIKPAPYVGRPFQGLPDEAQWVALREIVPSATSPVTVEVDGTSHDLTFATVLPMSWPAMKRDNGDIYIGVQSVVASGDVSRDLAEIVRAAVQLDDGQPLEQAPKATAESPRLQDLVTSTSLDLTVHDGFDFWVEGQHLDEGGKASMERANEAVAPTVRMADVPSAYWVRIGERTYVRWILDVDENKATDALARLHAAGESTLGDGRLLGAFRAYGLLVPVWEVPADTEAGDHDAAMKQLADRFTAAYENDEPLTTEERRARNGVVSRQITLR
ncbi:topoisomerase II [Yimella sp. cx-573]|nr:topoisomerase II [Yimella sp. cx-573]